MPVIDLNASREDRNRDLVRAIMQQASNERLTPEQIVERLLGVTVGNTLIDDELEEALVIAIANDFGSSTKNPQHDLNGGFEGNDGDDDNEDWRDSEISIYPR